MMLPLARAALEEPTRLILDNYLHWFGRGLVEIDDPSRAVETLFNAPLVVLSALGPFGTDHVFNYANNAALELFADTWDEFIGRPSSASAEPVHRGERRRLLDEVGKHGFIRDYSGIRISKTGQRFRIKQATVFNLLSPNGDYAGQAATFAVWEPLD